MLRIRCSTLETVKASPIAYAQLLAFGDGKNGGGTYGMFAYWQDVAKLVHQNELTVSQGKKTESLCEELTFSYQIIFFDLTSIFVFSVRTYEGC